MPSKDSHQAHILIGALLGTLATSATYLLLTTKKGEELRECAYDGINCLKHKVDDFIETTIDQGESAASDLYEKTDEYSDKIRNLLSHISDHLESIGHRGGNDKLMLLLVGGVVGGLLGAGAGSLFADRGEKENNFHISDLASYAATLHDALNSREGRKLQKRTTSLNPDKMNEYLDLAITGLSLWQKFQKK